jgi:broad specificity phosphatase PhoE
MTMRKNDECAPREFLPPRYRYYISSSVVNVALFEPTSFSLESGFLFAWRMATRSNNPLTTKSRFRRQLKRSCLVWFLFLCLFQAVVCWLIPTTHRTARAQTSSTSPLPFSSFLTRKQAAAAAAAVSFVTMTAHSHNNELSAAGTSDPTTIATATVAKQKRLICIRHARSEGNEFLSKPGNRWGDATFCDDATLIDAKLTPAGLEQVKHELLPFWTQEETEHSQLLQQVDLILVSPLTRTLETFYHGVEPALQKLLRSSSNINMPPDNKMPPVMAHPLCTERVYTASDTGRSVEELEKEFPLVDWSLVRDYNGGKQWWYTHKTQVDADTYQEWRPHGQGQWYAVPGEPETVFTNRMKALDEWLDQRSETTILIVAHWGVLRYITAGFGTKNCEVKVIEGWKPHD